MLVISLLHKTTLPSPPLLPYRVSDGVPGYTPGFPVYQAGVLQLVTKPRSFLCLNNLARPGVEPGPKGYEPHMLPLHYLALRRELMPSV